MVQNKQFRQKWENKTNEKSNKHLKLQDDYFKVPVRIYNSQDLLM